MGRFAILVAMAVACLMAVAWASEWSTAPNSRAEVDGPTYSLRALQRIEIEGLRLGMTREDAAGTMTAGGYAFLNPGGRDGEGYYERDRESLTLGFNRGGRLDAILYMKTYDAAEVADVSARRAELLSRLGPPTQWSQWVKADGEIGDRFLYLPRRSLVADYHQIHSCYVNWQCQALLYQIDCRPLVRRLRGGVITGSFGLRSLHIWAFDYAEQAENLFRDGAFRTQDLSDATCFVMPVH